EAVGEKVSELGERLKTLDKELRSLRQEQINHRVDEILASEAEKVGDTLCIIKKLDANVFPKDTHQVFMDSLSGKLKNGVAFFTHVDDGTLSLMAVVGAEARGKVKAGDLMKQLSEV